MFIKEHARMMFNENAHEVSSSAAVVSRKKVDDVLAVIVCLFQ